MYDIFLAASKIGCELILFSVELFVFLRSTPPSEYRVDLKTIMLSLKIFI